MAANFWNSLKPIIDAIVFSNTWISLAALSLYLSTCLGADVSPTFTEGILIFTASFIGYNFLKLRGLDATGNTGIFNAWLKQHKSIIYGCLFIASLGFIYALSEVSFLQLLILLGVITLSIVYIGFERYNLRSFWFLKTQIVALVWVVFVLGIPLIDNYNHLPRLQLFVLCSGVFFFILGLTIPFDIRDWNADRQNPHMTTLPMLFGLRATKFISLIHLLLAIACLLYYSYMSVILLPIFLLGAKLIYALKRDAPEYVYTFGLDGLIVLVYPVLWISKYFLSSADLI